MVLKSRSKISPYILDNHDHMTPGLKYNLRYHLIRKKKMNELPSLVDAESKPKVVLFYVDFLGHVLERPQDVLSDPGTVVSAPVAFSPGNEFQ